MSDEKIGLELLGARVLTLTAEVRDLQYRLPRWSTVSLRLRAALPRWNPG
jgi:hypothetical protein